MSLSEQTTQPTPIEYREIPLTKGQVAIVDAADYEALAQHKWCALWIKDTKTFYAIRNLPMVNRKRQGMVLMHREILQAPRGSQVDHRDGDGLNNRRANIRLATKAQNMWNMKTPASNTSGLKGASYNKRDRTWDSRIKREGRQYCLGSFSTAGEAHAAYVEAAKRLHGEFANWQNRTRS